jgi:alcohol dehydrogenase, propanol-preferring
MTTMRAAVVPELGAKLEVEMVPVPEPGPGQVLVKIEASGVCHTDIHAAHGDWPVKPNPPFIPGHEGVGVVTATGPGAVLHKQGDRVAVPWLASACGHCRYCVAGWETLCEAQQNSGYSVNGAYAEYVVADDKYVVSVPDGVSSIDAAPLTCAGVTTFKAIKVAGLQPGETASIVGIGGLGHLALQYARVLGARVIAVDVEDAKLDLARALGADYVINAKTTDPVKAINELGGADVAVVTAASPKTFEQAYASLRRGGRMSCVGLPADDKITISVFDTILSGKSIIGSIVGTRNDLADVFALHAEGRTKVIAERRELEDVNACFDEVLAGHVPARLVFTF